MSLTRRRHHRRQLDGYDYGVEGANAAADMGAIGEVWLKNDLLITGATALAAFTNAVSWARRMLRPVEVAGPNGWLSSVVGR